MSVSTPGSMSRSLVGVFSSAVDEFQALGYSSLINHPYVFTTAKLLVLGPLIETARRLFRWLVERFRFSMVLPISFLNTYTNASQNIPSQRASCKVILHSNGCPCSW